MIISIFNHAVTDELQYSVSNHFLTCSLLVLTYSLMEHFHFLTLTVQTKRTGAINVQIRLFLKETQQLKKAYQIKALL